MYGDFQTPLSFATEIANLLKQKGVNPKTVVEPSCGQGSFIKAALEVFPDVKEIFALDVNSEYISKANSCRILSNSKTKLTIKIDDFFILKWHDIIDRLPEPILFLGNPPWVTNAELGALSSNNLPEKVNPPNRSGLDAKTGKSNFDISEWMLTDILKHLNKKNAVVAMLCKTSVARKVLTYAYVNRLTVTDSTMYNIDTETIFNASVAACLLVCTLSYRGTKHNCKVYPDIKSKIHTHEIGFRKDTLLSDVESYDKLEQLHGRSRYSWRSGVKHDASKVMELTQDGDAFRNGYGERIKLEKTLLYPLMKSSDIANSDEPLPCKWLIVTQRSIGQNTSFIKDIAPDTWKYLNKYRDKLEKRSSSIYRNKPPFSLFGVGEYSFSPWKVAISGFYKKLSFRKIGCYDGKPCMLDDTCYFLSCKDEAEAASLKTLLNSNLAKEFLESFIFWDNKRPITKEILKKLDIELLANLMDQKNSKLNLLNHLKIEPVTAALF